MTAPATVTRNRTSVLMVDFLRRMERRMGRMSQKDLLSPLYIAAARVYAEAMIEAEKTKDKEKGQSNDLDSVE
jgi:hypothetical protein